MFESSAMQGEVDGWVVVKVSLLGCQAEVSVPVLQEGEHVSRQAGLNGTHVHHTALVAQLYSHTLG